MLTLDAHRLRADALAHRATRLAMGETQVRPYKDSATAPSSLPIVVLVVTALLTLGVAQEVAGQATPAGEAIIAWHVTIAPTWFDPSTAPPQITPFGMLYAFHDALVRPLPGKGKMSPSLAESWSESPDGLVYEFKLRRDLKFHNGDPVTTEDVKFSFERYRGAGAKEIQTRVQRVDIVDPLTVRFYLKEPWPDFMTFYGTTATAAGIVVPKKYLTEVGDDAFKKHPIGAGPYRFVSHKPGVEVVLEAYPGYWRRVPNVKTLVMKSVPESTTRAVMLKSGEADIGYVLDGPDADAGYPNGLDAGEFVGIPGFPTVAESVLTYLTAAGIRMKMRATERAAFYSDWKEKKLRGLFLTAVGNSGNAASRVEAFIQSKGAYAYGGYPDIDDLFLQQARERDPKKREGLLHKIQQLTIDRAMFAPVMDLRVLMGVGPRIARHTITDIWMSPFPSYEDMELKD